MNSDDKFREKQELRVQELRNEIIQRLLSKSEDPKFEARRKIVEQNGNSGIHYDYLKMEDCEKNRRYFGYSTPYVKGGNSINVDDTTPPIDDYAKDRKATPVFSGVLKYFPNALKEISKCSKAGNDQHHPDKPLHWDMSKSKDEYDALVRHLIDHTIDPMDTDGVLHLTKVAWRALAGLERHLTNNK